YSPANSLRSYEESQKPGQQQEGRLWQERHRRGYLVFKDVPEAEAQRWLDAEDEDEVQELVRQYLRLDSAGWDTRQAALLDYYSSVVLWCRENQLAAGELSVAYAAAKILLEAAESGSGHAQLVMQLKELLVGVGIATDGLSGLEMLGAEKLQALMDLFNRTLLQHLRLYQFLFSGQPDQVIVTRRVPADALPPASLPFPAPLCEGMPEELYRRCSVRTGATSSRARTIAEEELTTAAGAADGATDASASRPGTGEAASAALQQQQEQAAGLEAALAELTPEEVQAAVDEVCREALGGLEAELAAKLKEREVAWIAKINKVHNTA
ncbi:hypothetical protein BOX15_Mlig006599g1, partial [Macrostomum lignano]